MRKECYIVIGENELAYLLVSLDKEGRLNGNIIAVIGSDTDSCLSSEVVNKFKDIDFEGCIGLYTGACVNESLLVDLKSRCKEIYDVSLSYRDIQFATSLGLPHVSYTSFVQVRKGLYQLFFKRLLDILISSFGIIISSPIMLIVAILVRIKLGSPVTFRQARPGKKEKVFFVHKFRSMSNATDANGDLLPDDQRLTKFGKVLRSTSLDELPQLFSIFTGKMSLIGPRPQSFENVYFMNAEQHLRHIVTPGLTGLSQVNGRNAIPWDEKIQYDLDYVSRKITFLEDFKIFLKTIKIVLFREDITQEGSVSTESVGDFLLRTNQITEEEFETKHAEAKVWQHEEK